MPLVISVLRDLCRCERDEPHMPGVYNREQQMGRRVRVVPPFRAVLTRAFYFAFLITFQSP